MRNRKNDLKKNYHFVRTQKGKNELVKKNCKFNLILSDLKPLLLPLYIKKVCIASLKYQKNSTVYVY